MKHIFTRYQFELIFCFTLFLFGFFLLGLTDSAYAQIADPTNGIGTKAPPQDPGVDKNFLEKKIDNLIYTISTTIGMAVISLGGLLLDASINYGILKMGSILSPSSPLGIGVLQIWAVIRDILNILFIFGLIYVGISTILDSHKSETQRVLGRLIIAALFVNFSLYATQVVVDFTNILAIQVHNQIIGTQGSLAQGFSDTILPLDKNSISGAFLNTAGITSVLGGDKSGVIETLSTGKVFFYSIFMMTFLIIAGIVFAIGAVLLITRFAALILYMIFSPFMFAGWIFPKLGHASEEYWSWNKLLKQALFAPAFLFMLYLSLVVLQRLQGVISPKGGQFSNMIISGASAVDSFSMVMFFALMIVFLFASIKIATSMGVAGANYASKLTGQAIGGMTYGLAARVGRNTVGRVSNAAAESEWLKDQASKGGVGGWASRRALKSSRYVADSNMDLRAAGIGGASVGTARKGGYTTTTKEIKEEEEKFAKSLGEIDDEDKTVKKLKDDEHHIEEKIEDLKNEKELAATKDEKDRVQIKIREQEKKLKAKKEEIIREKNRRVVGSSADNEAYKAAEKTVKEAEANTLKLNTELKEAKEAGDKEGAKRIAGEIKKAQKNLKQLKKGLTKKLADLGYAGTLETSTWYQSWIANRFASQDRAAGKAIRKTYSKKSMKEEAGKHGDHGHDKHDDHGKKDAHGGDHGAPAAGGHH